MRNFLLAAACLAYTVLGVAGQATRGEMYETPGKMGGVYYAYPIASDSVVSFTRPPKGYQPFYISHYGRHGSRYLISDNDYKKLLDKMRAAKSADALSPQGEDVLNRLELVWEEARGRGGELSPLGREQHHAIATRMYENNPEVFTDNADITAVSTGVMRCAHSMFAFSEALKEKNPKLWIPRESGGRHMDYLCYWGEESGKYHDGGTWRPDYLKFKQAHTRPDRMVDALFSDKQWVRENIVPEDLMWEFYWVTIGQQNIETPVDFYDVLTPEELYDLWSVFNLQFYMRNASYTRSKGVTVDNAKNLLSHIIENADSYIAEGKNGATLRFGHDGNITPLTALMQLENCHGLTEEPDSVVNVWNDFFVSPMASNVQLIFYRNKSGDVLVKILHNERETSVPVETDIFPFYRWTDLRPYLQKMATVPFREVVGLK